MVSALQQSAETEDYEKRKSPRITTRPKRLEDMAVLVYNLTAGAYISIQSTIS